MPKGNPGQKRARRDCDNCGESIDVGNFNRHRATCELRDKTCEVCQKFFRASTSYLSQRTCGLSCRTRLRNEEEGLHLKGGNAAAEFQRSRRGTGTKTKYLKEDNRHQHRRAAEKMLGRALVEGEIVHHKDGNSWNNDFSNLEVMTQSQHASLHHEEMFEARMSNSTPEERSEASKRGWKTRRRNQE